MATRRTRTRSSKSTPRSDDSNPSRSPFRLGDVLADLKRTEGSFLALAQAISKAYYESLPGARRKGEKDVIDRRKLKSLAEHELGTVITPDDLIKLDPYLSRFGESLALRPILRKPDLMSAIGESGRVTFVLGAYEDEDRGVRMVSDWDLLGMGEVTRAIGRAQSSARFDVKTYPTRRGGDPRAHARDFEALLDDHGPSLCVLASPRANPFAELLLSAMFGCEPFAEGELPVPPPFRLCWSPSFEGLHASHFCASVQALRERNSAMAQAVEAREASVLLTADEGPYEDRVAQERCGTTYGVCVAQRRRRGQVWLLMMGITGVATYVSAKVAKGLDTHFAEVPLGEHSAIWWGLVKADVTPTQKARLYDQREFANEGIVTKPAIPAP